jgi:ADP-ribosylation factor-like protein 1
MSNYLCVGPRSSGKTMLLNSIQYPGSVNFTTHSVNTVGTNLYTINNGENVGKKKGKGVKKSVTIRELGGEMAVMWKNYYSESVEKILFVVDTSNLCQISCAGKFIAREE